MRVYVKHGTLLFLFSLCALAQEGSWNSYLEEGKKLQKEGHYAEAGKKLLAAVKEAEKFGSQDPRLATSLNHLGQAYYSQGKLTEAESLYQLSLAIRERVQAPGDPELAASVAGLAELYLAQRKFAEAESTTAGRCRWSRPFADRTWRRAWTIWRTFAGSRGNTPRPNRSTNGRWMSG